MQSLQTIKRRLKGVKSIGPAYAEASARFDRSRRRGERGKQITKAMELER